MSYWPEKERNKKNSGLCAMFLQSFAKNLCTSKSDKNRGRVGKNITTTTTENEKKKYVCRQMYQQGALF